MGDLLEVRDVSVSFGGLQALSEFSMSVPDGSIVGLIGPNGAGKTTLFNVISGLQGADCGEITFDGEDITALPPNARAARGIRRSFQHLGLINDQSVNVNIMAAQYLATGYAGWDLAARPWRWRAREAALETSAREVAETFGLTDRMHERITDLSFAMARFAELACVLVGHPRMMLLDEPTTGLDVREIAQLIDVLRAQRDEGTTLLVVAHDVRFVMNLCDHVYVLAEGRLLFDGHPRAVQTHPQVIEAYLGRSA